jgi:hypothetical protein
MTDRVDRQLLMKQATQATDLSDFGDIPFEEALDVLIFSLEREARLDDARRAETAQMIVGALVKRLRLAEDRKRYPAIADEQIRTPIFIVGLPRTGSTNLHRLMAKCEGIRAPRRWEMARPSPPPTAATYETDPRIAEVHRTEIAGASEELMTRHPVGADYPEQCQSLSDHAFMNWALLAPYEIPTYRDWLLTADHRPSYEAHRRTLQHLQYRHPGQWVLKYPKHILALDALIAVYPDAKLIWTHRDPAKVIPSAISLIAAFRSATPGYDPKLLGRSWSPFEELGLRRGLGLRERLFKPEDVYDMHYRDVMQDPVAAIAAAYRQFGLSLSQTSRANILGFLADNPKDKHGVHQYSPAEYGLDEAVLRTTFRDYVERFQVS